MPVFEVQTSQCLYRSVVERGILQHAGAYLPERVGKIFIVTDRAVWALYGAQLDERITRDATILYLPPGEVNKRLTHVEALAEELVEHGADRNSLIVGVGGGIVTDMAGFLAAIFMRGIRVLQIPTTLLAQVDAAVGGKTGVNLASGKNLIGSFHQPVAVLIDPEALASLPMREYRAGLYEVIKCAIIRDAELFRMLELRSDQVLSQEPGALDALIAAAVCIKAEVVSADEKEGDLRRILNFGHTVGHAIEAETGYSRFLHGEAVGWGMLAAIRLAESIGVLDSRESAAMRELIRLYGPLPAAADLDPDRLLARLASDKKTLRSGLADEAVRQATAEALCSFA